MDGSATEVRKGRKFDQVVAGAREVFLRDGFDGASVDEIARAAGVSKATLYNYFPDKRLLFMEVGKAQCRAQAEEAIASIDTSLPPQVVLTEAGRRFLDIIFSDLGIQTYRVCVNEAERFPALAREFYETGPQLMREALLAYFDAAAARGEIRIGDRFRMADQFGELCKARLHMELLLGLRSTVTQAEREIAIDDAVETFLARYGV